MRSNFAGGIYRRERKVRVPLNPIRGIGYVTRMAYFATPAVQRLQTGNPGRSALQSPVGAEIRPGRRTAPLVIFDYQIVIRQQASAVACIGAVKRPDPPIRTRHGLQKQNIAVHVTIGKTTELGITLARPQKKIVV